MGTITEVRIARRTGFCYGVREAIDAARISAAEGKTTHTLGQVVHNEGVNAKLRDEGVVPVKELDEVAEGGSVVIRAHGVTPEVMAGASEPSARGHRRHLQLGHPGAEGAGSAGGGGVHGRPPGHAQPSGGRRSAGLRA